ncbi:MAG: UDP-glucose/GDP-mannose dehydrogenase family protein, partial [Dehalococcoidia bacterium]|nr:UDP-glucose/GDP-mannose dehydrogenase family protein [Dehalococcoidia bacterium]
MEKDILIIGSGVVGSATGKGFVTKGHRVVFYDTDRDVLNKLSKEGLRVCEDYDLGNFDVSMVCVSTPVADGSIDLSFFDDAIEKLGTKLAVVSSHHLVVVRSTVLPGTTEERVIPMLERCSGKKVRDDFDACFNPEFLRESRAGEDFIHPWVIAIGTYDQASVMMLDSLYRPFEAEIIYDGTRVIEMAKYVHNLFNATKISFFNEIYTVCQSLGIDGDAVSSLVAKSAEGLWNPEYGIKGGSPYGGTCLPKDTRAFRGFARQHNLNHILLDAVIRVNEEMG